MSKKEVVKVKRVINYYELDFKFKDGNDLNTLYNELINLEKSKNEKRYLAVGEKLIFIQGFENNQKFFKGKIRCIRKDVLPELMNTETDETKEIEAEEEEGLVETTHFIIDYRNKKTYLALEYNHYGSKITDFVNYIQTTGLKLDILIHVGFKPIVKDDLAKLKEKINRFSEFIVKIHKDNIDEIKKMDSKIWGALNASFENFQSEYATLILKFDYKQYVETPYIKQSVFNLISFLAKNNSKKYLFNKLEIKAEDESKNNLLEHFDLLLEKVNSEIKVERKPKYRTIISIDMFEKMINEINKTNFK
jgi:hypothetical protein